MTTYQGAQDVDQVEREQQRALTRALWETLRKGGLPLGQPGRIASALFAPDQSAAEALLERFRTTSGGWASDVRPVADGSGRLLVWILSPEVALTLDAFLELVDVMLVAALRAGCTFDGFELEQRGARARPWWKFW